MIQILWNAALGNMKRSMPWYCEAITSIRELHFFEIKDMGDIFTIETRKYTCFCGFCIDAKGCAFVQCENNGNMSL